MKRIILAAALWLAATAGAFAQCSSSTPLPTNTVLGRLGINPGPCQAISFATLTSNLAGFGMVTGPATSVSGHLALWNNTTGSALSDFTGTSGGIPYFGASGLVGTSALLTQYGVMIGGGAAATPATVAVGTNNQAFMGSSGAAPGFRALVGADLPAPGASSLGGVGSITCATHQWLNTISIAGVPACAQPAITDISGWGTGVATALGISVGSAGAPVLFNGAGGTPSSLTLTNATGLPFAALPAGTSDTALGYWGSTVVSALAINNCTNALTYSTSTHTFGCNTTAGTGTVTSVTAGAGLSASSNPITASGTISADILVHRGYLAGLTLSTAGASSTFGIAAGVAVDSTNTDFMKSVSAYTKTTGAWAVGTGNGALDTGTIAASTWYHVFLMKRPDTGVVDVCISVTVTACTTGANIPVAYTLFRRIGSMKTDGSSNWTAFFQNGDTFLWSTMPALDYSFTNPGTAAVTVSMINGIPPGVRVEAILNIQMNNAANAINFDWLLSSLDIADTAPGLPTSPLATLAYTNGATVNGRMGGQARVWTNASQQIRSRLGASDANTSVYIQTTGWRDPRGT